MCIILYFKSKLNELYEYMILYINCLLLWWGFIKKYVLIKKKRYICICVFSIIFYILLKVLEYNFRILRVSIIIIFVIGL